jgi:dienelactone hydrolase
MYLRTMDQLAASGQIDVERIATQGHSRGGAAILSALCMARHTGFTAKMCAAYAAYPWSGQQFLNPLVGTTKVRSVVGDQDEWCSAQQIQGQIQAIRLAGGEASCRIFEGAHHSFDRETPVELVAEASVARGAPTIYIDDTGAAIHPVTGVADPEVSERDLMLYGIKAGYGKRGAKLGTSGDLAAEFHDDMMAFWKRCLQA